MSTINTSYAAMQYGMNTAQKIRQQDSRKADTGEKVKETEETQSTETKTERQIWEYGFFCFGYHR